MLRFSSFNIGQWGAGICLYCTTAKLLVRKKFWGHTNPFHVWLMDDNIPKDIIEKIRKIKEHVYEKPDFVITAEDVKEIEITKSPDWASIFNIVYAAAKIRSTDNQLTKITMDVGVDDFIVKMLQTFVPGKIKIKNSKNH
jgi:hypothetical protein